MMTGEGFEPSHPKITQLECVALDHSAIPSKCPPTWIRTKDLGNTVNHYNPLLYQLSYRREFQIGDFLTIPGEVNCLSSSPSVFPECH